MCVLSLDARKRDHKYSGLNQEEAHFPLRYIASVSESKVSLPAPTITCIAQRSRRGRGGKGKGTLIHSFLGHGSGFTHVLSNLILLARPSSHGHAWYKGGWEMYSLVRLPHAQLKPWVPITEGRRADWVFVVRLPQRCPKRIPH